MTKFDLEKFKNGAIAVDNRGSKYTYLRKYVDYMEIRDIDSPSCYPESRWLDGTCLKNNKSDSDLISLIEPEPEYEERSVWIKIRKKDEGYLSVCPTAFDTFEEAEMCTASILYFETIGVYPITIKVKK